MDRVQRIRASERRSLRATLAALACCGAAGDRRAAVAAAASDTLGKTTVEQRIVPDRRRRLPHRSPARAGRALRRPRRGRGRAPRRPAAPAAASRSPTSASSPTSSSPTRRARRGSSSLDPAGPAGRRRLAALGGARAVHRRRDDPPGQRLRGREPRWPPATARAAPMDFTIDTGDSRRQPAAERDRVGADAARGRHRSIPNSGIDPAGYTHPLCPPVTGRARRLPRRRYTPASRTTTTTPRAPTPTSTTPTTRAARFDRLPAVHAG